MSRVGTIKLIKDPSGRFVTIKDGKSKVEPVLFKSNEIDIVVLPVRVDDLKWDIAEREVKIVKEGLK